MLTMSLNDIPGAPDLHCVDINTADEGGGPDGGHQRPGVYSGVPQVHHQVVVPRLEQEQVSILIQRS